MRSGGAAATPLLLITCALYVTFALDHPFTGLTRVSALPMLRLAQSIGPGKVRLVL